MSFDPINVNMLIRDKALADLSGCCVILLGLPPGHSPDCPLEWLLAGEGGCLHYLLRVSRPEVPSTKLYCILAVLPTICRLYFVLIRRKILPLHLFWSSNHPCRSGFPMLYPAIY
ncbi:hypothetical protein AVEN_104620-1 [Araneus ventricosus]|uniref:Uncharacterized protein n=1 Tax=Araneus ventricosus TaxID=182803 RepID=A0A4Y2BEW9_ARAVE|nr:hypothetical protein AVEN_104620-1 [Araneus ventricosus]